ncbi:MAG: chloride channel protein [Planctomycetes bacterium]|nr:chloride channel protein [Planctomycetota bacterium]
MSDRVQKRISPLDWLVVLIAAGIVGLVAYYFAYMGRASEGMHDVLIENYAWVLYLLPAIGLTIITLLRVTLFLGTEGTGIPQTIAALGVKKEIDRTKMLSMRILVGKIILTTFGLFSGASMGREGPTVQAGACIMFYCRKIIAFPQHIVQRGLILAGGAAGIAAAFNAPIAGIVFSIEEISRSFDKRNLGIIICVVMAACLVCIGFYGDYWFYGEVESPMATWQEWIFVPLIASAMGLGGGLFSLFIISVYPKISKMMLRRPIVLPMSIGLLIGFIGWLSAGQTLGTGFVETQNMLIHGEEMNWYYGLLRMTATALTLLSGIPGGLFDPTLSAGAGFGQWFTSVVHNFDWASTVDANLIMMIAMACFFAAVVQSPITAVVIMVEMTDALHATLPMFVGALIAYMISTRICTSSIYVSLANDYFNVSDSKELPREA